MTDGPRTQLTGNLQDYLTRIHPQPIALTRFGVVLEGSMQDRRTGLITVTASADGADLRSWDQVGLFGFAALRAFHRGGAQNSLLPPSDA